jgi:hypothetical protein
MPRISLDRFKSRAWIMPAYFAGLALCLFGDCLVVSGRVPAEIDSDLRCQYLPWRQFAFDQIRSGHFPLWNPYQFSGTPFFGDPQSAMLYPPNWLNLVLSPPVAASWLMAGHFFLAAYFTGLWARRRGLSLLPCLLAGTLYGCCGTITTNIRAGHLPLLCSAARTPLLFICVDGLFDEVRMRAWPWILHRAWRWILLGSAVVAMLATDGFPQFAYDSALAVALYALLNLRGSSNRLRSIAALVCMYALGAALAGAQLLASAQVASESVRAGGLSIAEAGTFALPPENLLTLLVPGVFGDRVHLAYYGRWYWWEACIFIGPAAVLLAVFGAAQRKRQSIVAITMIVVTLLVALGPATPLFTLLYHALPAFGDFRAPGRFALVAELFIALLAGEGLQHLSVQDTTKWRATAGAGLLSLVLIGAAIWVSTAGFDGLIRTLQTMDARPSLDPNFPRLAAAFAAREFAIAAGVALLAAIALAVWRKKKIGPIVVAVLAGGQIIYFAFDQRASSDRDAPLPANWATALAALSPGDRAFIYNDLFADGQTLNAVGYNPLVLNRMGHFLAATQNQNVAEVGMNAPAATLPPVYRMLRASMMIPSQYGGPVYPLSDPLPRLKLMGQWKVAQSSEEALSDVLDSGFDPALSVILESAPVFQSPAGSAADNAVGSVRLLSETVNDLEIEADVSSPRVLLITDAFSAGWRVVPLDADTQQDYRVIPGDYCLRAIPLAAGHHHFRLEYRPTAVIAGAFISIFAIVFYLGFGYAICFSRLARPAR